VNYASGCNRFRTRGSRLNTRDNSDDGYTTAANLVASGHEVVALIDLGLLIKEANNPGISQLAQVALAGIVLAALGGSTLFVGFHMRRRALPIPLVIGQGLIAATGYVLLLVTIFRV